MGIHDDEVAQDDDLGTLGLTEEELLAVKGDDEEESTDDEGEEGEPSGGDAEDEDPAPEAESVETSDDAEEDSEGDSTEDEAPSEDPGEEDSAPEATGEVEATFAPQFQAGSTEGLVDQLETMTTEYEAASDALAAKYEAGETSFSAYRKEDRALTTVFDKAKQGISEAILEEKIAANHSKQSADQKWEMEQSMFYADNDVYRTDPIMRGALGAQLEQLYADEKNSGKTGLWFLQEAGRTLDAKFGRSSPDVDAAGAKKVAEAIKLKAAQDKQRKKGSKDPKIPKSLSNVPAADTNNDDGEFAYMDKLSGLAYEGAIAKMSEDTRERFMEG